MVKDVNCRQKNGRPSDYSSQFKNKTVEDAIYCDLCLNAAVSLECCTADIYLMWRLLCSNKISSAVPSFNSVLCFLIANPSVEKSSLLAALHTGIVTTFQYRSEVVKYFLILFPSKKYYLTRSHPLKKLPVTALMYFSRGETTFMCITHGYLPCCTTQPQAKI